MTNRPDHPPFIWGAQYYRAPTPDPKHWENDLANMRALGFTDIKYWVQWRWSHREENAFYFDDTDKLMDLAAKYGLRVTINTIFDVTPSWFLEKYPDCRQIRADGQPVEPYVSSCRQIGGMPGPCYNHAEGIVQRKRFMEAVVSRYKDHPAMFMWDVWNEPEQCHLYRAPEKDKQVCFCPACRKKFIGWLTEKYGSPEQLNRIWGRCYTGWNQIELPRTAEAFGDYLDWREFHLDTMTAEAEWRLETVRRLDPSHPVYLHVVPNTSRIFNAVTGVDDFALARRCDVFASTNFASPIWSMLTTSAAEGKPAYNVECHIGTGMTNLHPRHIAYEDIIRDFAPQLGMGLRGFMFWQYHAETLGFESPAWGVAKPDGSIGSIGIAAEQFMAHLGPYVEEILAAAPPKPEIAIWKGRRNELFQYAIYGSLESFANTMEAYANALYSGGYSCRFVDDEAIIRGLDGVKLLILPMCYALSSELAGALDAFVRRGGTLLCEAHPGGYDCDANRHAEAMPGQGLREKWGIREEETMAAYHLGYRAADQALDTSSFNDDMKKSLAAYGVSGGKFYLIQREKGGALFGAERFARLASDEGEVIGRANGMPCILRVPVEKGTVIYCGTNLGEAAAAGAGAFGAFLEEICTLSGVKSVLPGLPGGVHCDRLGERLLVLNNTTGEEQSVPVNGKSIFFDRASRDGLYALPPQSADILLLS